MERVQDEVERVLMECGHYEVAKAYILYREKRAALRRVRADLAREVGDDALEDVLRQIQKDFEEEVYPLSALQLKFESFCKPVMTMEAKMEALTKAAVELTTVEAPKWEFIAARLLNHTFSKRNASRWTERGVKGLYEKLRYLTDKGLYGDYILARYSREEIDTAEGFLCPRRSAVRIIFSGMSSPSRYSVMIWSSSSEIDSSIWSRYCFASSSISAGMASSRISLPSSS